MISISEQSFRTKPTNYQIPSIKYITKEMSLEDIANQIILGHAISANFDLQGGTYVVQKNRTTDNFCGMHFVMFDLDDDVHMNLTELNEMLKLKPSLCYTTYSHHQKNKGNRYRLLYFFSEMICDVELYHRLYDCIAAMNNLYVHDRCGHNPTQNVLGTYYTSKDFAFINNNVDYHIDEVLNDLPIGADRDKKQYSKEQKDITSHNKREGGSIISCKVQSARDHVIGNPEFMQDYETLSITELIQKYSNLYPNIQETPLPEADEDVPYILFPKDYACIRRRWTPFTIERTNGSIVSTITRIRKIRDGEGRRRLLFLNGILRRLITEDTITFDNLLFNLLYEFFYFYEHVDITKKDIKKLANRVWNEELSKFERLRGADKKFKVNQRYCEKYSLRPKQVRQIAMKQFTSERIGELYDFTLSAKENIEFFRRYGLDISTKTLNRWKKEQGLTKEKKTKPPSS